MVKAKNTTAIANLRLVCSLGLPSEMLVPAIAEALHALLGFSNISVHWFNRDGGMDKIWCGQEPSPAILRDYTDHFIHTRQMAFQGGFSRLVRLRGVRQLPDWGDGFYATDYYDAVWRPLRLHIGIVGAVRSPFDAICRSVVTVYRPPGARPFGPADVENMARALPYLVHAFGAGGEAPDGFVDTGVEGLVVVNRAGIIQFATRSAVDLLFYGSGANVIGDGQSPQRMAAELIRRVVANFDSPASAVPPPSLYIGNAFGRFTFRAHWFEGSQDLIGISARRQEPLTLRLARGSLRLPLSPTQKQILLFAAQQQSNTVIAQRLHIKPDTVKGHVTTILERLGIHDRNRIVDAVLREDQGCVPLGGATAYAHLQYADTSK